MSKLYACIISSSAKEDRDELLSVAHQFSYAIETLEDGILFAVGGLEKLVGDSGQIAHSILNRLKERAVSGNVAVAETVDSALLLARRKDGLNHVAASPAEFHRLPLHELEIENDSIGIFQDLGINCIEELRQIPAEDLINRYGQGFKKILDIAEQKGRRFLTPNVKQSNVRWNYELDLAVDDFEQLIFILNHGLDNLFGRVGHYGFSTEHLDIFFKLSDKTEKSYEIKASFPTLG
ncbi:MAG TPA: hypothetical protein VK468_09165, partial [Pyrinomonadaceae bacterium]|nr:hypothetical protein [Pyrinomonadaceae bacterium]